MTRTPLEFLGKSAEQCRRFSKTKKIEVIFFDNLQHKNALKHGSMTMPFHAGYYDYTCDIINLFLQMLKIKPLVFRANLKKSKQFVYHIYLNI